MFAVDATARIAIIFSNEYPALATVTLLIMQIHADLRWAAECETRTDLTTSCLKEEV
jgi:hypothetical protein